MKHEVTLKFNSLDNLKHFVETINLRNFKTNGLLIMNCMLTFREIEIAKQYGASELSEV